jgi:hypothetical protein
LESDENGFNGFISELNEYLDASIVFENDAVYDICNQKFNIEYPTYTDLNKLEAVYTKRFNNYMKNIPGYNPNNVHNLSNICSKKSSFLSSSKSCTAKEPYDLDASIKQALELDDSFKINETSLEASS